MLALVSNFSLECDDLVPLIMGSQYRVTDNQITASTSLNHTHLPKDARLPNGSAWCSEQLGLSIHDPWLQVNFGADIVIHTISISGSSFSHVTSFQIQSAVASIKELQYLTIQGSESPHVSHTSVIIIVTTACTDCILHSAAIQHLFNQGQCDQHNPGHCPCCWETENTATYVGCKPTLS